LTVAFLECARDGVACGRFELAEGAPVRLGRGAEADARVEGEPFLSRLHAEVTLKGGTLTVRRLPTASNPIYHDGSQKDEFRLEPGEFFLIGATRMTFSAPAAARPATAPDAATVLLTPAVRRTMEPAEMYAVSDRMRLKDLLELPEILQSKDRGAFHMHIASMLRMATGARWAAVLTGDGRVLGRDSARDDASFGVSATLCEHAVKSAPKPIFYSWRQPTEGIKATAYAGADWAVCAAVGLPGGEHILFYAAGSGGSAEADAPANIETTRFVGLVADIVGRSLSVRRHEEWETRLRRFFAKSVADELLARKDFKELEPRLAEVTALFFDIRGFSKLAETVDDILVFQKRLKSVMTAMTDEIQKEQGVVLQYMGDGILACWNVPRALPDHADRACRAALAMRRRLAAVDPELRCGLGLHAGRVVAGAIGSEQIFSYGVIGTVINQASRVEGITKAVGAPILATEETVSRLSPASGLWATPLGQYRPAGMTVALSLYELRDGPRDAERVAAFRLAWARLHDGRWDEAIAALASRPEDDAPARYLRGYAEGRRRERRGNWTGVVELSEK
jgi:adenylate cyclase